jgi:acetolactate synthase I/II/III large subunit
MSDIYITVGELAATFLEACEVQAAFGVISIHNMPILDAFNSRKKIRFVPARGEAGACNAAGAMIEAYAAGTPLLHLTGQIDSAYLDKI